MTVPIPAELEKCRAEADRYRLLAEQSTDMISRQTPSPDWTYIDVSPAVERLLGYKPEELIGTPGRALFHPDDADNLQQRAESVRYVRGMYTNVYRYRHKQGHYVCLETTSRTIRDKKGQPQEIICVTRDVTEREQAQQSIRRLARVVEASSDMILFCSPDALQLTYLNESACLTLGADRDNPGALSLPELFDAATAQNELKTALLQAATAGSWEGTLSMQLPVQQRHAEVREIIAHRNRHENMKVEYYSIIARDITIKRKAEEEAKRHQLEMAHMSRLLSVGEMATGLAHELNQPLAAILNYSNGAQRRLDEGADDPVGTAKRAIELISRQARRAAEIIKRMRSFVRKTEYQRLRFPINDACVDVSKFLHQEAQDHSIRFEMDLDPSNPTLLADKIQIEQVLLNLMRNAIEAYSDCGKTPRPVMLSTRSTGDELHIRITDKAKGISAEALNQLFEPFYTSKSTGLGMGLPISRTIIETHGGQLWAESDGHSGTCFHLKLPLKDS
ncbi:MAG: PAS domain S-box protein [Oceanospirillales bacterium]|nr:PAS domain S-box protein [Oceanospirillales bacterium]